MIEQLAKIQLQWLAPEEGGRKQPFVGGQYTPTASFVREHEQFSVFLRFSDPKEPNPKEGMLGLLHPHHGNFQSRISPGAELEIMEGPRVVARCHVTSLSGGKEVAFQVDRRA